MWDLVLKIVKVVGDFYYLSFGELFRKFVRCLRLSLFNPWELNWDYFTVNLLRKFLSTKIPRLNPFNAQIVRWPCSPNELLSSQNDKSHGGKYASPTKTLIAGLQMFLEWRVLVQISLCQFLKNALDSPTWESVDPVLLTAGGREVMGQDGDPSSHRVPAPSGSRHHLMHVKLASAERTELPRNVALSTSLKCKDSVFTANHLVRGGNVFSHVSVWVGVYPCNQPYPHG